MMPFSGSPVPVTIVVQAAFAHVGAFAGVPLGSLCGETQVHAEVVERVHQAACPLREVAVPVAVDRLVGQPGHDLACRRQRLGAPEDGGERQRKIHHQSVHARIVNGLRAR